VPFFRDFFPGEVFGLEAEGVDWVPGVVAGFAWGEEEDVAGGAGFCGELADVWVRKASAALLTIPGERTRSSMHNPSMPARNILSV